MRLVQKGLELVDVIFLLYIYECMIFLFCLYAAAHDDVV